MKIHEYQAKEIFSKYGIPVERHTLCRTAAGVVAAYRSVGADRVVIKAQVLTGGRGKAGGVKLVNNTEDAYQEAKNILGMSIKGLPVNQILVSEAVDITGEYYVSFTIDRNTRSVILMMSASGGMDIEQVARQTPEKIIRYSILSLAFQIIWHVISPFHFFPKRNKQVKWLSSCKHFIKSSWRMMPLWLRSIR